MPKALLLLTTLAMLSVAPTAAEVELPGELLVALRGTEPTDERLSPDLVALAGWLGDARVVGLGETLHGVHEFRRLAHRVFAHLVEAEGFDVFALEINQAHAARLNDFVEGRRDDLDALLAQRWWAATVFYDPALRELLLWMRRHNETAEKPIHFAGFDFKQPSFAMEAVVEGLRQLDPSAATEVQKLHTTILELEGLGVYPNVYGYSATLSVPLPPRTGPQPLRIQLKARGRGVSHGWVGISVEGGGADASLFLKPDKLGDGWAPLDIETEVADRTDEIRLTIFHRGNGTVWFDGLEVEVAGRRLELERGLGGVQVRLLDMPRIQVMDYESRSDDQISHSGGTSLRVDCDLAVDAALRAAREASALLEAALAAQPGRLSSAQEVWLRQMSRLALQATEYRTLVETHRDLFLAENVAWLEREGFPDSRVLLLAHSSHTNRNARGKGMGLLLAEEYGDRYKTVTMLALSGQFADFGDQGTIASDSELELYSLDADDAGPMQRLLGSLGPGDWLLNLERAAESEAAREQLDLEKLPIRDVADVAILVRTVHPSLSP